MRTGNYCIQWVINRRHRNKLQPGGNLEFFSFDYVFTQICSQWLTSAFRQNMRNRKRKYRNYVNVCPWENQRSTRTSLISLVPERSGLESAVPLEEFFDSIEGTAQIWRWEQADKLLIAVLKLTDCAKMFYNGCPELHGENATWEEFKTAFRKRFRDVHSDQCNFMKLKTARQGKNESPRVRR
jgi:hypothetical protein